MAVLTSGIWRLNAWQRTKLGRVRAPSKVAEVKLQITGHLDEHAEKALDELRYQFQQLQGAYMQRPLRLATSFFVINGNRNLKSRFDRR